MLNTDNSIKMKVYNGFMEDISKGKLEPGSIVSERMLMEKFNCSRAPVREALLELCKDGILINIPRCGYQVVQVSVKSLHEITQMRLLLELDNFDNIAPLIENSVIDFTFLPLEKIRLHGYNSVWEANENNSLFHTTLAGLSGNRLLVDYVKKTMDMYSRAYAQMYVTVPQVIAPMKNIPHNMILEAWKKRDYETAKECLRQDIVMAERELQLVTQHYTNVY